MTSACFWYVFKQVDPIQTLSGIARLDVWWAAFATFIVMLQIPLVALRWRNVLRALDACNERMTRAAMIPGTAHAIEESIGMNDFPLRPQRDMSLSIRNAASAM